MHTDYDLYLIFEARPSIQAQSPLTSASCRTTFTPLSTPSLRSPCRYEVSCFQFIEKSVAYLIVHHSYSVIVSLAVSDNDSIEELGNVQINVCPLRIIHLGKERKERSHSPLDPVSYS